MVTFGLNKIKIKRRRGMIDVEENNKRFDDWIVVKSNLHRKATLRSVKEGDVWWCAVGENVGIEINGKSETFARPVLVFRKLSRFGFMGVPLTSQKHEGTWYSYFEFKDKEQYAALAQARVFSVSRLYKKIGMVPNSDLQIVRNGFHNLYC